MKKRCALLLLGCTACTSPSNKDSSPPDPVVVRVGTLNIEYGGMLIDFDAVVDAALLMDADVLGVEEAWGNIPLLAEAMGWPYYDASLHVVSRLPLLSPADGRTTLVEVEPGAVFALANLHLPSDPYGPYRVREGISAAQLVTMEETVRLPALSEAVAPLVEFGTADIPVFAVGDFNAPSHLDWTEATVGQREHVLFPVAWPTSLYMDSLGFRDSYREIYPDPVAHPGLTWPAQRPVVADEWNPAPDEPADRIDFVFAAGPSTTQASIRIGEEGAAALSVDPWPTDHRGVVSTFFIEPAEPPTIISVAPRVISLGEAAEVRFHESEGDADRVELRQGSTVLTTWPISGRTDGAEVVEVTEPGEYTLALAGEADLATTTLTIVDPSIGPTLTLSASTIASGAPITVSWSGAPGNRWDWLALFHRDADPTQAAYRTWAYTGATVSGSLTIDEHAPGQWPLPAGDYSLYLLEDDGYEILARVEITITE